MSFKKRNIRLVEDINFLNNKFIIFDNDTTEQDVRKVYQFLTSMGATPLSVAINSLSTDTFINRYIPEIMEFIDNYDGAYFRVWKASWSGDDLALDYGTLSNKDLDLRIVDPSRLIDYREILDLGDTNFFPEELNESRTVESDNLDRLLNEYEWVVIPVENISNQEFLNLQDYLFSKQIYWQSGGDDVREKPSDLAYIYVGRWPYYHDKPPKQHIIKIGWTFNSEPIWDPCNDIGYREECERWEPEYRIVPYLTVMYGMDTSDIMDDAFGDLNESKKEKTEPKKGDLLYCYRSVIMDDDRSREATKGKTYKIKSVGEYNDLYIINDSGTEHSFSINKNDFAYYGKWFKLVTIDTHQIMDDVFGDL